MIEPCARCNGEGFIDLGADARICGACNGTGMIDPPLASVLLQQPVFPPLTPVEAEMLNLALRMLARAKPSPLNRRLGRPATPREIVALAHKLGLSFGDRHREELRTEIAPPEARSANAEMARLARESA